MASETDNMTEDGRALTFGRQILYSTGMLTTTLTPTVIVSWLMYYYAPPSDSGLTVYLTLGAIGFINFFGRLVDSVADPLVGYWSDRTRSPRGRRIPFLLYWAPPLALSFALIWFPVTSGVSKLNFFWLLGWISLFWFAYTAVVAPYLSMHPEITPYRKERISVSAWMGVFELAGAITATVLAGKIIGAYKNGVDVAGFHIGDGYKVLGILVGALILITYYVPAFTVKERPHDASKEVPFGFFKSISLCFKNPAFLPYIIPMSLLRLAGDVVIGMIPYLVKTILWPDPDAPGIFHGMESEDVAGIMQGALIIIAALLFPLTAWLGGRFGKKPVFWGALIWFTLVTPLFATIGLWPGLSLPVQGVVILVVLAPAVSPMFVLQRPIIADVMDYDEKLTGYRREAMYNGVEGLCTKFAAGMAPLILSLLFLMWGNTSDRPLGILAAGPAAAVFGLVAAAVFRKYPFKN